MYSVALKIREYGLVLLHKAHRLWICKNNREIKKRRSGYFCCSKSLVTRIQLGVIIKLRKHTEIALRYLI